MAARAEWKSFLVETLGIAVGTVIIAAGLNMFLIANKLAAGGISGLGIIFFHLFQVPVGLTIFLVNIPLFILAVIYLGKRVVANSILGMLFLSVAVELLSFLPLLTTDLLLASVYGGILMGIGLGVVFRFRGSTGGTALSSLLLHRFRGLTAGQGLLGSDILIIGFAAAVFGLEIAMYATLSLFVSSWVIDVIQEGLSLAKAALIISESKEAIAEKIFSELDRGVTFLGGQGAYTGQTRDLLLCVVARHQVSHLKTIVYDIDPKAFMIVGSASEVLGEGFRKADR